MASPTLARRFALAFLILCAAALPSSAALKIYYLRHAESGGNIAKDFEKTPPAQRPPYVGNPDTFSPLGWKQAAAVPDVLAPFHFDFIAVSPLWRTRNTIRPYLYLHACVAELWPELREFGGTDKSILLVGHGTAGRHFLHYLTGDDYPLKTGLKNAGLWLAEEQPDGSFRLTLANSAPLPPQR